MAQYSERIVTKKTKELYTPAPADLAEIGKMISMAKQDLGDRQIFDDTIQIRGDDQEIVVFYDI